MFILVISAIAICIGWLIVSTAVTLTGTRGTNAGAKRGKRIQVLVLGDIGRSPRMQYHTISLIRHGCHVDLIGYVESALHPKLQNSDSVTLIPLQPFPKTLSRAPFIIAGPLKVIWQVLTLIIALWQTAPPAEWIVVQNPPSIPTLHSCYLVSTIRGTKVLVDWHNYGWTILAMTKGMHHPFVRAYKMYESYFGRLAPTSNLAVTDAMAHELRGPQYGFTKPIHTLHDRPASHFQPIESAAERESTLSRIGTTSPYAENIINGTTRLIVSSTSWTPDEDFAILLDALVSYATAFQTQNLDHPTATLSPRLVAVITGKGPQKAKYEALIEELTTQGRLPGVKILTAWLSIEDYAALLACADLGVCLHKSSSGVDLPMKVVDMFGAGLPVAAYGGYASFQELIKEGVNGAGFSNMNQLGEILLRLLSARGKEELAHLRRGAVAEGKLRWDDEWDRVVAKELGLSTTTER